MSLDFAHESFFTFACSSCVSADSYPIENLISAKESKRCKGFQGERFVRAPTTLQFQFYAPVHIHRIEFNPFIGRQCARIVHLLVSKTFPLANREEKLRPEEHFKEHDHHFRKAGDILLTTTKKVVFVNRGYTPHPRLPTQPSIDDNLNTVAHSHGDVSSVTTIRILIKQMLQGSIPSLSDLHIWRRPARSCPAVLYKEIMQINELLCKSRAETQTSGSINYYGSESIKTKAENALPELSNPPVQTDKSDSAPLEFYDPITFELMRMPVLLPSGHTIDRTTLDKHIKSQEELGNVPSDPYTGMIFNSTSKPQPNMRLKLRLDNFKLQMCKRLDSQVGPSTRKRSSESLLENIKDSGDMKRSDDVGGGALSGFHHAAEKRKLVQSSDHSSSLYCANCQDFLPLESVRYRLPCQGIICGSCVRKNIGSKLVCPSCMTTHERGSIQRLYT